MSIWKQTDGLHFWMSLKGRFRRGEPGLFSDSSASLRLPGMITLSRTAPCCDDSLLETLHRLLGSWLSPSSANEWSEKTVGHKPLQFVVLI